MPARERAVAAGVILAEAVLDYLVLAGRVLLTLLCLLIIGIAWSNVSASRKHPQAAPAESEASVELAFEKAMAGQRIQAVNMIRQLSGSTLRDAADVVDEMRRTGACPSELPPRATEADEVSPWSGRLLGWLLVLAAALFLAFEPTWPFSAVLRLALGVLQTLWLRPTCHPTATQWLPESPIASRLGFRLVTAVRGSECVAVRTLQDDR